MMRVLARCMLLIPQSINLTRTCSTCLLRQPTRSILASSRHRWLPRRCDNRSLHTSTATLSNNLLVNKKQAAKSGDGQLVYQTHMTNYVYWLYAASAATTSFLTITTVFSLCLSEPSVNQFGMVFINMDANSPLVVGTVLLALVAVLLKGMHAMLRRTVFRLNYREDTQVFTALTYNWHLATRRARFVAEDVAARNVEGISQLKGNYIINGRQYIILEKDFISPVYFHLMTGGIK